MALNSNKALAASGVIVAGILTAAANVGALGGVDDTSSSNTVATVGASAQVDSVGASSVGPDDLQVVVDSAASSVEGVAVSSVTIYRLGDAGSISVSETEATLTVVELSPAPGWTAADPDDGAASSVYAIFNDGTTVIEVRVKYVDGALVPNLNTSPAN